MAHIPNIFNVLDLSTAHLPERLGQQLNTVSGVIAHEYTHGWLLFVPENIDETLVEHTPEGFDESDDDVHGVPQEVVNIWRYAEKHDCQYVLLDSAGEKNPDLPTYEW